MDNNLNEDERFEPMPDGGNFGIPLGEAIVDVVVFLAKAIGYLLVAALIVGVFVYGIWRELAIVNFLTSN